MTAARARFFGKYRGIVHDIVDPERRARIRAVVPDVFGAEPTSWAMPCAPFAGPAAGFVALPPAGAGVWIEFEQGDPDFPIWSGCWWGQEAELPAAARQAPPGISQVTIGTTDRHVLVLSDVPGPTGGISLRTPTGAHITVTDAGIVVDNGRGASITLTGSTVHIAGTII